MAQPDNMLCGTCLSEVVPKYSNLPNDYFRCCKCGLAACYERSCSGKSDYFKIMIDKRPLYRCIRCKPPQKPRNRRKPEEIAADPNARKYKPKKKRVRNPLFGASQQSQAGGTSPVVSQIVDLDAGATAAGNSNSNSDTARFVVPDESALIFRRSSIVSRSPRSPAVKRHNDEADDEYVESEFGADDSSVAGSVITDATGDSDDSDESGDELPELEIPKPDIQDRAAIDKYVIDSLAALTGVFKSKVPRMRRDLKDQRFLTRKVMLEAEVMRSRISVLEQSNAKLLTTCNELGALVTQLQNRLDASDAGRTASETAVNELKTENQRLTKKVTNQETRSRALEDYSRQTNLIVAGLHDCPTTEAALGALNDLAAAIKVELTTSDIYACHSLPSRSGPPRLLIKFTSRMVKESFVSRVRAAKLTTGNLGWPGTSRPLRLSDHLSPATSELLSKAKRRLHWNAKGDFKYIWTKHGRILAKVADRTKVFEIRCEKDIEAAVQFGADVVKDLKAKGQYVPAATTSAGKAGGRHVAAAA
ncbi:hypothetical protein ACFE04_008311 [Oxalis oulophora]